MVKIHAEFRECLLADRITSVGMAEKHVQPGLQRSFSHIKHERQGAWERHCAVSGKRIVIKPGYVKSMRVIGYGLVQLKLFQSCHNGNFPRFFAIIGWMPPCQFAFCTI
jgi:hypothetical protein